ncbi:branched-chain amino acid ABC transporter permease [Pseudomonas cavernae]|uniref:Branched-chain amino acid ABC transporter permease n=1 Tax=Pseudomonas cavernae TaxID=2320867 RepID=A0A385Z2J3_9PSED|nr:branched-chain amino acid ABC transporter permease [Pseudomonas cavernae]AYC32994.1 branched-chain amino acid ABC transporter permease [Pseudomonas cavernae]
MTSYILQQAFNALTIGSLYALIALGYTMVYGVLRLINFVHGELFMLGGYICLGLLALLGVSGIVPGPLLLAVLLMGVFFAVGFIGIAIERVAYRPLRHSSRLAPLLSALGLSLALQAAMQILIGPQPLHFPAIIPSQRLDVAGASITTLQIGITLLALLLLAGLYLFVEKSRMGVYVRAVSESPRTAGLIGINVNRTISLIFLIGPGLGAVAGILYSSYYGVVTPTMGVLIGMKAFTAAILGGIGSIPGAVLGGILLGLLEVFGTALLPVISNGALGPEYRDIFAFAALILVLLFRPAGLLGQPITEESMVYKRDF